MDFPPGYLKKLEASRDAKQRNETEYSFYVGAASKMIGQKYIVLHKRIERAFVGKSLEYTLGLIKRWYHEAEKTDKPAVIFNVRFKQYRGEPIKQNPNFKNYNKNI